MLERTCGRLSGADADDHQPRAVHLAGECHYDVPELAPSEAVELFAAAPGRLPRGGTGP